MNKKIDTMSHFHQKMMKNKNALGVNFLQAKNTRVNFATYAPTLTAARCLTLRRKTIIESDAIEQGCATFFPKGPLFTTLLVWRAT